MMTYNGFNYFHNGAYYTIIVDDSNRINCDTLDDVKDCIDRHLINYDDYFGNKRFSEFFPIND